MSPRPTPVQFRHRGGLRLAAGLAIAGGLAGLALSGLPAAAFGALAAGAAALLTMPTRIHRFRSAKGAVLTWVEVLGIALTHRRVLATFEDVEEVTIQEAPRGGVTATFRLEGRAPAILEVAGARRAADLRGRVEKLRRLVEPEEPRSSAAPTEVD